MGILDCDGHDDDNDYNNDDDDDNVDYNNDDDDHDEIPTAQSRSIENLKRIILFEMDCPFFRCASIS